MITINAELTDTFAGEANYSWVRRAKITAPDDISNLAIVRRVKKELGLSGVRFSRRESFGDYLAFWYPDGDCAVLFISFEG